MLGLINQFRLIWLQLIMVGLVGLAGTDKVPGQAHAG